MLRYVFTCAFLMFGIVSRGQTVHEIGVFKAFPVGKFAGDKLGGGGFATHGWGFQVENRSKAAFLPDNLTVGFLFSYQNNSLDTDRMAAAFSRELGHRTKISDTQYQPLTLIAGPSYTLAFSKVMHLDLKAGIGAMFTDVNSFRIDVTDAQGAVIYSDVVDLVGRPSFAYSLGASLRANVADNFSVGFFGRFNQGNESMEVRLGRLNLPSSSIKVTTLNTGFSIHFKF